MTDLAEKKLVEGLSSSALHRKLRENHDNIGDINQASVDFMNAMVEQVGRYQSNLIEDFRCFESDGLLIGALYDKAFIAYPENFGVHVVKTQDSGNSYCLDGKSFGLIISMVVCRDLSKRYERQGDWDNVLQVLEAYFATHDAFLSAGNAISLLPDSVAYPEIMAFHNLDMAFKNILQLKSDDGVNGTYERLVKAREITSKPIFRARMRIRKFFN